MQDYNHVSFEIAGFFLFPASRASSVARHLGLSRQYVTKLMTGKAPIPPSLWPDLERLTAQRLRNLLRWYERLIKCRKTRKSPRDNDLGFSGNDFASIATAMYGEKWTGWMASRMDMSPEYMRKLAKGERPMRQPLLVNLEAACRAQIMRLQNLEEHLSRFPFSDEIACDWAVEDPKSVDNADGGLFERFVISRAFH